MDSDKSDINAVIREFNESPHGNTDYDKDSFFVMDRETGLFCPLNYLKKKRPQVKSYEDLLSLGHAFAPASLIEHSNFKDWFEKQFSLKVKAKVFDHISILYDPSHQVIFQALEAVERNYEILRQNHILLNGENLPIQLGEWYAKCIFGLSQVKSTSQRGFDFHLPNEVGKQIEVKVHWSDISSPKGVKVKKSLVELSDYLIIIYLSRNFMIRDICFLDSEFILRKFSNKGHTIFMKDSDIGQYFFSKSTKQFSRVVNKVSLMTFASPTFAMKLEDRI